MPPGDGARASEAPAKGVAVGLAGLVALSAAVFLAGLGRLPLFGRDEALYAEAAREMLASRDWVTPRVNAALFFEKPPLYYWLAAISYTCVGVSPLAARLPSALAALLTIAVTTLTTARAWGARAGLLAGMALATSLQMAMIGRMGIMDVPLTCLVTLSLVAYARSRKSGSVAAAAAFGALVGLAVLLKGLAGGLAPAIAAIHAILHRRGAGRLSLASAAVAAAVLAIVATPWFAAMWMRHGEAYLSTLLIREHLTRVARPMQGHGGPVFYYLALIAVAFFPWVSFLPAALVKRDRLDDAAAFWRSLALVWLVVVLVPFSLIRTKLPGYVTPLFPAMAMLVGVELDHRLRSPGRAPWAGVIVGACLLGALFAVLPVAGAGIGARVGASHEAWSLVVPTACWVGGYAAIAVGGVAGLSGCSRRGLAFLVAGQAVILGALLIGVLPRLSPYLGGGPARLAELARRELPGSAVVLYETRPETVAFALGRPVPVFSRHERQELIAVTRKGAVALIAPLREESFWRLLPRRRMWQRGADVLLDIPAAPRETLDEGALRRP